MVKWFCSSALCFNNFTSKGCNGRPLKYYRLPREESIKSKYGKIFPTDGINWNKGHISLLEKCPNTEFFLVRIFPHSD